MRLGRSSHSTRCRAAYTDIRLDGTRDTPRVMVTRLGQSLSSDPVLVGTLWRYRDRSTIDGFPAICHRRTFSSRAGL